MVARPRPLAALLVAACAAIGVVRASASAQPAGIAFDATGSAHERSGNAALRPQELPSTPSLDRAVELLNKTAESLSLVNPFALTPTPAPATTIEERAPTPTQTPTPTPTPTPTNSETTIEPTSTAEPSELPEEVLEDHGSYSGSGSMAAHRRSGRKVGPASAPTPPQSIDEETEPQDGGPETAGVTKRTNVIAFDVVPPQSAENDEDAKREETSRPPAPSSSAPAPAPAGQPAAPSAPPQPAPPAPAPVGPPAAVPSSRPPTPVAPGAAPPTPPPGATPAAPGAPTSVPPAPYAFSSLQPRNGSVAPGAAKSPPAVLGDSLPTAGKGPASHSSSSAAHEPTVGHVTKPKKDAAGSGSASTSTETSTQSESSYYSMGTASILSIVGVLVGILVIIALFVLISRREYDDDDDDDRDVLGYGGDGGFKIGDRPTIVRLSPTFLMNGAGPGAPGQPHEPDFSLPSPLILGSNRGATGSNRGGAAVGSSRGYAPTGAVPEESPAILESSLPPRGGPLNEGGASSPHRGTGRSDGGGFQHSDDISTLDSRGSDGWSSVMESEFDMRSASRCTRDTTFSNITMSQNLSEVNSWDLTSQHRTGSGRGTFRNTTRRTGGGGRGTRTAPPMPEFDFDEEYDDTSSVLSYDVDEGPRRGQQSGAAARSTDFSSYRSSAESQFSDYRSTTGFGASRS